MMKNLVCKGRSLRLLQRRSLIRPPRALLILGAILFTLTASLPAGAEPRIDLEEEIGCLALNLYFEARGEPDIGKIAVAHVVLNRVVDQRFPSTVCDVVRQGGEQTLHRCQFSWWCDGQSDKPSDTQAWEQVKAVARKVYWGFSPDPTDGALWYHAASVSPSWGKVFNRGPKIGQHLFYADDTLPVQLTALPSYE